MGEFSFIPKKKICPMEAVKILEYKRKNVQKSCYLKKKIDFNSKSICDNIRVQSVEFSVFGMEND